MQNRLTWLDADKDEIAYRSFATRGEGTSAFELAVSDLDGNGNPPGAEYVTFAEEGAPSRIHRKADPTPVVDDTDPGPAHGPKHLNVLTPSGPTTVVVDDPNQDEDGEPKVSNSPVTVAKPAKPLAQS